MKDNEVKLLAKSIALAEHADISGKRYQAARLPATQHEVFVEGYRTSKQEAGANDRTIAVRVSEFRQVWRYLTSEPGMKDESKTWNKIKANAAAWAKANDPNASLDVEGQRFKSFEQTVTKLAEETDRFGPIARVRFALIMLLGVTHDDKALNDLIQKGGAALAECIERASKAVTTTETRGIKLAA